MATSVSDYFEQAGPLAEFKAGAYYFETGDFLICFAKPGVHYAERVDSLLTVYRSNESDEIVGCKVKSVRWLFEQLGDYFLMEGIPT